MRDVEVYCLLVLPNMMSVLRLSLLSTCVHAGKGRIALTTAWESELGGAAT